MLNLDVHERSTRDLARSLLHEYLTHTCPKTGYLPLGTLDAHRAYASATGCLEVIAAFVEREARLPTGQDWKQRIVWTGLPSRHAIRKHFGTITACMRAYQRYAKRGKTCAR